MLASTQAHTRGILPRKLVVKGEEPSYLTLKYSIEHPILLNVGLRQSIYPKSLSFIALPLRAKVLTLHLVFLVSPSVGNNFQDIGNKFLIPIDKHPNTLGTLP